MLAGWQHHEYAAQVPPNLGHFSSFGNNHLNISTHMCKISFQALQYIFHFHLFSARTQTFISIKWLTHAECKLQSSRDPETVWTQGKPTVATHLCPQPPQRGPQPPSVQWLPSFPPPHPHSSSYALSPLSCLLRLSNGQPPLIPALLFLQIKFQLFVNLCENDKPVPELSFNTQKHK